MKNKSRYHGFVKLAMLCLFCLFGVFLSGSTPDAGPKGE